MVSYSLSHTVSLFDHHKPADVHQLHPSDCPPVRPSSEQNLPGLSNGSFAIIAGFLCGYPMGAKISTDLTHTKQISPQEGAYLLSFLQQYKSGLYFQFCSLENTGKKRTDDSVHPDPDSCAHSGQLFTRRTYLKENRHFRLRIQAGRKIRSGPLTFWITALWTALKQSQKWGAI